MMKNRVLLLLTFLFSLQGFAANEEETIYNPPAFFITYEQFMSLTNAEQKTYVKKVKEIVDDLAKAYPDLAQDRSARSSFFQVLWDLNLPSAQSQEKKEESYSDQVVVNFVAYALKQAGQYSEEVRTLSATDLTPEKKQMAVESFRQAMYWTSAAAAQTYTLKDEALKKKTLDTLILPASKKVTLNEDKIKTFADESQYREARDEYFKKSLRGELSVMQAFPSRGLTHYDDHKKASVPISKMGTVSSEPLPPETGAVPAAEGSSAASAPPPSSEVPPKEEARVTANTAYYRCMYAGFVVKKDPCMAPRELPWSLDGLDSKSFACGPGTVMCNPLIFGFNSDCDWSSLPQKCWTGAKPYCVKPGLFATKNCTEASNNERSLQATVELIKRNPKVFNEFGSNFAELCYKGLIDFNSYPRKRNSKNIQKTKEDIKKTCQVAEVRMAEVKKRYGLNDPATKPVAPGSSLNPNKALTLPPTGKDLLMKKSDPGKK